MVRKLVYFSQIPLLAVTMQKYYMEELVAAGFEVEYLDLGPLFPYYALQVDIIQYPFEVRINSNKELDWYLQQQDVASTLFISNITYYPLVLPIFRQLKKHRCRTCCMAVGMLPTAAPGANGRNVLLAKLRRISFRRLCNYFQSQATPFLMKVGYLGNYNVIFYVGDILWHRNSSLLLQNPLLADSLIAINTTDYDLAWSVRDKEGMINGDYILFLDEYLPLHPDCSIIGRTNQMDTSKYYQQLNDFFDRIEQHFQMPVIIAAHPKAERYRNEDFFRGRTVIFGETALLSRDAHWLMTHHSTAIGFAPIFRKPVLFISSEEISSCFGEAHNDIVNLAQALGSPIINYDDTEINLDELALSINEEKYNSYKYSYLTSPASENQSTLDILLRHMATL